MVNIIIVSRFLRTPKRVSFADPKVAGLVAGCCTLMLALAFGAGFALRGANGAAEAKVASLKHDLDRQQKQLVDARKDAQREINAIAARVGELQAQANRLNALGQRLTRNGKLSEGEFDFDKLPGMGGAEAASDVAAGDLLKSLDLLQNQFDDSGRQLTLLESMLYDQQLQLAAIPSGRPSKGYITSGFGKRNDPFRGGLAHHLGIDFDANTGDPAAAWSASPASSPVTATWSRSTTATATAPCTATTRGCWCALATSSAPARPWPAPVRPAARPARTCTSRSTSTAARSIRADSWTRSAAEVATPACAGGLNIADQRPTLN